jgi:hypothetical protein
MDPWKYDPDLIMPLPEVTELEKKYFLRVDQI